MAGSALIAPCEACDRPVSRAANACPQCGHPIVPATVEPEGSPGSHRHGPRSGLYLWSFCLGLASMLTGGTLGLLAWATIVTAVIALVVPRVSSSVYRVAW